MAAATTRAVQTALRPFGLYWRARTLHEAARQLTKAYEGRVPVEIPHLMELPGVGPYVAAATVSAVSKKKILLIDTNTARLARRVAGLNLTGDIRRRRIVVQAVIALLGGVAPASDWWAALDLAAKVCLPNRPLYGVCPIRPYCLTGRGS